MMEYNYLVSLKEFTVGPSFGDEEVVINGVKAYTSDKLKINVKNSLGRHAPTVSKRISVLIDNNTIIPVFVSKNLISRFINRREWKLGYLGTTTYSGKIYLFLDYFYSLLKLSSVDEKKLTILVIHELMHLIIHKLFPRESLQINLPYYIQFYKDFFSSYVEVPKDKIPTSELLKILMNLVKLKKGDKLNFVKIYLPLFNKIYKHSNFYEKDVQELFTIFIDYLNELYEKFVEKVPHEIWKAAQIAYKNLSGKESNTVGQEFWAPDEIVSILSELNPSHPAVTKTISLLK